MPLFSRKKNKGAQPAPNNKRQAESSNGSALAPQKPRWQSSWSSNTIDPAEVEELIRACTVEMKSRGEQRVRVGLPT